MLTIDLRDMKEFKDNFTSRRAKGFFFGAIRQTINDQAKNTRITAMKRTIPRAMNTRSSFNQRSIWTTFAKGRGMVAFTGARDRFTGNSGDPYEGLGFIETRKVQKNPGIPTLAARGGSKSKKVKKKARYPQLAGAIKLSSSNARKTMTLLSKRRYKGAILIRKGQIGKGNMLRSGYYKFAGRFGKRNGRKGFERLELIKDLSRRSTVARTRKWLWPATQINSTPSVTNRIFIRNVKKRFERFVVRR